MMAAGSRAAPWLDGMKRARVLDVAAALGLHTRPARGAGGGEVWPCPACGRDRRNATTAGEKRGAIGVRREGLGWHCFPCDAAGDALDLASHHIGGRRFRDLADHSKAEARDWCGRFLGLDTSRRGAGGTQVRKLAVARAPEAPEREDPAFPPAEELAALWGACVAVTDDAAAGAWLAGRGLDVARLADLDAVRALPLEAAGLPAWARSWGSRAMRLVVPLVDAHGRPRSVLARTVTPSAELPADARKSVAPAGFARAGLAMACPLARQVLGLGARPSWWSGPLRVVVAEGEPDYMTWASASSDAAEHAPAVLGIVGGSWTPDLAERIPDGAELVVRTHDDDAGAVYATKIVATMAGRVAARRIAVRLAPHFMTRSENGRTVVVRMERSA